MEHKATVGRKSRRAPQRATSIGLPAPDLSRAVQLFLPTTQRDPTLDSQTSAPKGREDSAQGFNPGLNIRFAGALKAALDSRRVGKVIHLERIQSGATHKALRTRPRRRPRPRIWPRGMMEYWSVGVLRQVRIAPRVRGVGDAEGAEDTFGRPPFGQPLRT
jgi:hypothetical protein